MDMSNGEIHLWMDSTYQQSPEEIYFTYQDTYDAIKSKEVIVNTTIPYFLQWKYRRRLFVHINNIQHELTLGDCDGTNRCIREAHNMEKLLLSGAFSWFEPWRNE